MVGAAQQVLQGPQSARGPCRYLEADALAALLETLRSAGYTPIGPLLRDGAIVYGELRSVDDLPRGWSDRQEGGRYRLEHRDDGTWFGFAVGPHSWKSFLFPPSLRLWSAERTDGAVRFVPAEEAVPKLAFVGVRGCEIKALAIQDRVFLEGSFADPVYRARREATLIVAVQCGSPGGTCFCESLGTGPRAEDGYDLALTEIMENGRHYFAVEVGTARGEELLAGVPHRDADASEASAARRVTDAAASRMGRRLDTAGLRELLAGNYEHPHWAEVAQRCLACGNCTSVCPTCFCSTVDDVSSLSGQHAERWRRWDSCFTGDFSYIHGGEVRRSVASRYRQWLMHKFRTWVDQFGTPGCVGCGRCITWCPVGIDLTEELATFRTAERRRSTGTMLMEKGSVP